MTEKPKQQNPLDALATTTREQVGHKRYAEACKKLRDLEFECVAAFKEEREAAAALLEEGVTVSIRLKPVLEGARRIWAQENGQRILSEEAPIGVVPMPESRRVER